jgi:hypothetical protein
MPRKTCPRLRSVTIKGKEFYQMSVPQPGGGDGSKPLRTVTRPSDSTQPLLDEISRMTLYSLKEEARRYVHGEMRMRIKDKPTSIR